MLEALFILLTFPYLHTNTYLQNNIYIFKPTIQPFLINGVRYRESINPIFGLHIKTVKQLSGGPIYTYSGNIQYGNNQLSDITIGSDWANIDYTYIDKYKDGLVYILATSRLLYPLRLEYKLMDNGATLWENKNSDLNLFDVFFMKDGLHNISLWARSNTRICLCSSYKNGFSSSYQLVAWEETNNKQIELRNASRIVPVKHIAISNTSYSGDIKLPIYKYLASYLTVY